MEPQAGRRSDAQGRPARADLLNQVESDLRGAAGLLLFSPEVERRFLQLKIPGRVRHLVWTSLVGLALYNLFLVSDAIMVPDISGSTRLIHLCVTAVGLVTVFLVNRRIWPPETVTASLVLIVGSAVFTIYASHTGDAVFISFTIPLLVVFGNIVLPLPFRYAVGFSIFSSVALAWVISEQRQLDVGTRTFIPLLGVGMAFYTLIATFRIEKGERQAFLLTLRETLRGEMLVEQNRELSELSETDGLTGVANRRVFDRDLERIWKDHRQSHTPVALLIIDIDHFKRLNDTHGHINGDICLRTTADRLRNLMQPHQSLARYGGEEFAVLLEGEGAYRAESVAERLRAEIEAMPVLLAGAENKPHHITISIGCATAIPRVGLSPAEIFVAADRALYRSKHEGRNRVRVDSLDPIDPAPPLETIEAAAAQQLKGGPETNARSLCSHN